jgi:hypothetical protein
MTPILALAVGFAIGLSVRLYISRSPPRWVARLQSSIDETLAVVSATKQQGESYGSNSKEQNLHGPRE